MDEKAIAGLKNAQKRIKKLEEERGESVVLEEKEGEFSLLTEKERLFCEEYISTGNLSQAARHANISRPIGYRYLERDEVKRYISHLRNIRKSDAVIEYTECCEILSTIARDPEEKSESRIKAIQEVSKLKGLYEQSDGQTTVVQVLGLQAWNQAGKTEDEKQGSS